MREVRFDTVHLAAYSVRPGTAAARRADDVPLDEKKRRLNHLLSLQRAIAVERNTAWVGREVEVLVEGLAEDGRAYGRTRQGKIAYLPADIAAPGTLHTDTVRAASAWQLDCSAPADA